MLCVRNFFVVGVVSEEAFEQMVQGKTELKGDKRNSLRFSRIKSVKIDRTSINDDDNMAFNEPPDAVQVRNKSPTSSQMSDQDLYGYVGMSMNARAQTEAD